MKSNPCETVGLLLLFTTRGGIQSPSGHMMHLDAGHIWEGEKRL